jgi:hypothetical protein
MVCLADSSLRDVGLSLAVATMRKGERCKLQVQPLYGYGERGARSSNRIHDHLDTSLHDIIDMHPPEGRSANGISYQDGLDTCLEQMYISAVFRAGSSNAAIL